MGSPEPKTVKVLLIDDHEIWRGGLKSMLEDTEFEVVGEASSGREGLELVSGLAPQLVLLDIRMADGDGLETLQMFKAKYPQIAVLMLTSYDNPTYMARAVVGGASGYILKGTKRSDLLNALRSVANGEMLLSADILVRSLKALTDEDDICGELLEPLTDRETEVLRLLSTGLSNRDIGNVLFVSDSTIKTHVEHTIRKLGVSDRVQAAVWAARNRML